MTCNCAAGGGESGDAPTVLEVQGMTCSNCVRKVTEALGRVAQVDRAMVDLEAGRARVSWAEGAAPDPAALVEAVRGAGFRARVLDGAARTEAKPAGLVAWQFNVVLGAFLTAPLLIGEWFFHWGETDWFKWLGFACAAPVVVVCGRGFFVGAWRQLQRGASNMDTLVALGSSTAFLYSTAGLLWGSPGHLYFMEAAAIITLISAGHWLEALAGARAAGALRALMTLAPSTARQLTAEGREVEVPVAALRPGDRVALRPGDHVPTDGEVLEGESALNETMLTGESMPVEKSPGARLYAGTLNQDGRLIVRVTATGEATALARIIAVVQRAQNSRANIQRLADRVSNVFVPIVVLVAVLTALFWGLAPERAQAISAVLAPYLWPVHLPTTALAMAVVHATAVLIVACPCAMGLATPAAIMAGTNAAARRGILIRDGQALEKSGRLTAVAFDKTGTLTLGRVAVVAEAGFAPPDADLDWGRAVLGLARSSHHPVSRALARWAERGAAQVLPLDVYAWQERRGRGIEAAYAGATLRLGSISWLTEAGVQLEPGASFLGEWATQGATVVGLARDADLLGLLAVRDEIKPGAGDVVRALADRGLRVYMITGDQHAAAAAVGRAVGIPETRVLAGIRPEDKAARLEALQRKGERIAFVGDGINDAPALEQADLGIAVGRASDVARESADIILLHSDLPAIPEAIGLAQATLRTIRQNLFWAFFYNAAAVPLAALGFLSPVLCALAMGLSDVLVIGNALRLNRWKGAP